ncbi:WbqC family protein [Nostoc sp.]|uniref:WbqC family protein n=1 Tax=Nostoc sp. TaxID=1180 RepID=UPI002FF752E4
MQPYLFPYLGYFQLINIADKFVIHDDVQYIKGGWINRNRILLNREAYLFTLSIKNDSAFLNINQRFFTENFDKERRRLLNIVELSYRKAPYYSNIKKLLDSILSVDEMNISRMITHSLKIICDYLDMSTEVYFSSELNKDNTLKGEERVISINKCLGSDHYINSIGGEKLYSREVFKKNDIKLSFLQPRFVEYSQFDNQFVPWLSIIDVLMFNDKQKVQKMLNEYDLI